MPDSVAARFTDRNVAKSNVLISKCGSTHVAAHYWAHALLPSPAISRPCRAPCPAECRPRCLAVQIRVHRDISGERPALCTICHACVT